MMEPPIPINHPIFGEGTGILSELGCELPTIAESAGAQLRVPDESNDILARLRCLRAYKRGE
jgi:hypothetical protein